LKKTSLKVSFVGIRIYQGKAFAIALPWDFFDWMFETCGSALEKLCGAIPYRLVAKQPRVWRIGKQ